MKDVYKELKPPERILLGPGPSNVNPRVYKAMMTPVIGYLDSELLRIMDEVVEMLRKVFKTKNSITFPLSGTGTAGMETALCNVIEPEDEVLVCIKGYFGARIKDIVERLGGKPIIIEVPWGEIIPPEKVEKMLKEKKIKLVAIVHAETSTGVLQPLKEISNIVKKTDALLLVDTVASLGGTSIETDELGIDIVYSATQKCLSGPPGLAPITFSKKAIEIIRKRKNNISSFYLDINLLEKYWFGEKRKYHHTISMSLIYALHEALQIVLEEGLEKRFERHRRNAEALRSGLKAMGLKLIAKEGYQAPMITAVAIPDGVSDKQIRARLLKEYGIEIGGGLGEFSGKIWRIGLMGESSTQKNVLLVISALEKLLSEAGYKVKPGTGVSAVSAYYQS
ncbi:alanine--glyoxylate aminotransferase family protein [Candidatus Aminicenantes bacterium AC-708-M15]|jgi:alanine-glyoxylate transaminase/serine-glyoxylate transaminase/serine-pyruvate transaminase|nr:alanine--glyoxylate aminotransferase family protein [SCandidatus Aminicenantes bacterium Aminicenantia_JdfR_composite]MCP2597505.1 alanine--glyoxylate aminotransferase family protein [Candidatus Aminicenantes bacterium AC-335-G13]MCP2604323.1 alanine--glyoxylate aminotransferase family protein [Candidatus Aminicenantes bacterium AC-708-M15]